MQTIKTTLSYIDLFQVDSIDIQRQRRKTKTILGGILTLLVPIFCIITFSLLMVNNNNKSDIITNDLINTDLFTTSIQANIEWNTDFVNINTLQTFELVTTAEKNNLCYKNKKNHTSTEIPLCNYGSDLLGEPNGLGYVFKLKIQNDLKPILPLDAFDLILHIENNSIIYVLHTFKNKFCIYFVSILNTISNCYNYNIVLDYGSIQGSINTYYNNDILYFSIKDHFQNLYLFINHTLIIQKTINKNDNGIFLSNSLYLDYSDENNKFKFIENNTSVTVQTPFNNIIHNVIKTGIIYQPDKILYYKLVNIDDFTITLYIQNISSSLLSNTVIFNTSLPLNYTSSEINVKQNGIILFYFNVNTNCIKCNTTILSIDLFSLKINTINLYKEYTSIVFRKLIARRMDYSDCTLITDSDISSQIIKSIFVIDKFNSIDTIPDFSNQLNWFNSFIWSIIKNYNKNTYTLTFMYNFYPQNQNDWNKVISTGNAIECTSTICKPLFSSSFNINKPISYDNNLQIGTITLQDNSYKITLQDVLGKISPQNEYKINVLDISKQNENYFFNTLQTKTLYSILLHNENTLNITYSPFSTYYTVDNTNTGNDKKFKCIPEPNSNKFILYSKSFLNNFVDCPIYNIPNIPFIFDNSFSILKDSSFINIESTNLTGAFILNLNQFFHKTTITSTKTTTFVILTNVASVFTSLITAFLFFKKSIFNFTFKQEINRKDTVINDHPTQNIDHINTVSLETIIIEDSNKESL